MDKCLTAFEDWLPTQGYLLSKQVDGRYASSHTHIMWVAWQEAWHYSNKHPEIAESIPAFTLSDDCSGMPVCSEPGCKNENHLHMTWELAAKPTQNRGSE